MERKLKTYAIVFTLKQYSTNTAWVENVLLSGLNRGESIEGLQVVDLTEYMLTKESEENNG